MAAAQNFEAYIADPGQSPVRLAQMTSIEVEDLTIDIREITTGVDVEYRLYAPGTPHFGDARLRAPVESPAGQLLFGWWSEVAKGKNIRKNITVVLFKTDKTPARKYEFYNVTAEEYQTVEPLGCQQCPQELVLRCAVGGLSMESLSESPASKLPGVYVGLSDGESGIINPAGFFTSWSGGENLLHIQGPLAAARFRTNSPGHKSVGEVTLRGDLTDGRKAMCDWINSVISFHKDWKRNLTITELLGSDGRPKSRSYIYYDAFPVRYTFPSMSVSNTTGNVIEEVRIKPIRCELK
jgi:hypothetical protein